MDRFLDRHDAGMRLAESLPPAKAQPLVLGLARGGLAVAQPVAEALGAPLDVFVARKLGAPRQEELAIGAIAPGGVTAINEALVRTLGITADQIKALVERERGELERRVKAYRGGSLPLDAAGREVILVDDGLATGYTAVAALRSLRSMSPERLIFAAPVCSETGARLVEQEADLVHCLIRSEDMGAVGAYYHDFRQLDDRDVERILAAKS